MQLRMAIQWLERHERQRLTLTLICQETSGSSATHQMWLSANGWASLRQMKLTI